MTLEIEKMMTGQLYQPSDPLLAQARERAHTTCHRYNLLSHDGSSNRKRYLKSLLGKVEKTCLIEPPFFCDYGYNISLGDNVYFSFNRTILDHARVRIGNGVKLGPGVHLYTAVHPINPGERSIGLERSVGIEIEDNVWVGSDSIIFPCVHIGQNTVVGSGSVVTESLPANVVAVSNPCRPTENVESLFMQDKKQLNIRCTPQTRYA
ncbi:maltose o-acetyltransferase [Leptolyngbya sp. Heron Island J]|uniref:sugar O-acetyltransferase n=1 Tax=Leptolyngbya sp. Heron Island J TaxID=1385935 RepID=UPI0003B99A17|nr:sugar O-acetyltransferase [Leptolyngbya sp. Heron Island J]ESA33945.1 maltose o-acetyltransferase [Leptolyngbya sp. Heron Island J]